MKELPLPCGILHFIALLLTGIYNLPCYFCPRSPSLQRQSGGMEVDPHTELEEKKTCLGNVLHIGGTGESGRRES